MASERIEGLLKKYWEGETTLQEEKELKKFFQGEDIPPHLQSIQPLFRYYHLESVQQPLNQAFDAKLLDRIDKGKTVNRNHFGWGGFLKVAASILLIGLTVYYFYVTPRNSQQTAVTITYEDPELAYRQTKAALLLISEQLNAGRKYTAQFKKLGEADALFKDYENK